MADDQDTSPEEKALADEWAAALAEAGDADQEDIDTMLAQSAAPPAPRAQMEEFGHIHAGMECTGERTLAVAEHLAQRQSRFGRNAAARQRRRKARQVGQARVEDFAPAHIRPRSATRSGFHSLHR